MNHCVKLICVASLFSLLSSSCSTYKEGRDSFPAFEDLSSVQLSLDVDTAEYRASSSLDIELLCANTEEHSSEDSYSSTCVEKCSLDSSHSSTVIEDYSSEDSHSSTVIEEYFNLPNPTVDTREYKTVCEGDNEVTTPIQQFSITDEEREMLKYIVEQETRGGSYRHKCIVTNVILNRVRDSRFPNTVKEVLLQRNQFFSLWNYYQKRNKPDESTVKAVNDVLNGRVEDESSGALYFHSMDRDGWFSSLSFVMEVEGHRFFK